MSHLSHLNLTVQAFDPCGGGGGGGEKETLGTRLMYGRYNNSRVRRHESDYKVIVRRLVRIIPR